MPGLTQARDSGEPGCPRQEEGLECLPSVSCRGEEGECWLVQRAAGIQLPKQAPPAPVPGEWVSESCLPRTTPCSPWSGWGTAPLGRKGSQDWESHSPPRG